MKPDENGCCHFTLKNKSVEELPLEERKNRINTLMEYVMNGVGSFVLGITEEEFKKVCDKKDDLPEKLQCLSDDLACLNCHPDIIKNMPPESLETTKRLCKLRSIVEYYAPVLHKNETVQPENEAMKYYDNEML